MSDEYALDTPAAGSNRSVPPTRCPTCRGDRFVVVRLRSPEQTIWMREHGRTVPVDSFHEEWAACPDCHPIEISYHYGGHTFRQMDAAAVRQALSA